MTDAKKAYKAKTKRLCVDFYLKDKEVYEYAKKLNFSKFVKDALKEAQKGK